MRSIFILLCLLSAQAWAGSNRQKMIDFDDELVEGMNKKPLDSVSQLGEGAGGKKKPHLYRKRSSFKTETRDAYRTLGMIGSK